MLIDHSADLNTDDQVTALQCVGRILAMISANGVTVAMVGGPYMRGSAENAVGHYGILNCGIAFLQKPFALDALVPKLREVLGPSHHWAELGHAEVSECHSARSPQ